MEEIFILTDFLGQLKPGTSSQSSAVPQASMESLSLSVQQAIAAGARLVQTADGQKVLLMPQATATIKRGKAAEAGNRLFDLISLNSISPLQFNWTFNSSISNY